MQITKQTNFFGINELMSKSANETNKSTQLNAIQNVNAVSNACYITCVINDFLSQYYHYGKKNEYYKQQ